MHSQAPTAISVTNTKVGSCIDYCKSLLFVVPDTHVKIGREYKTCAYANCTPKLWTVPYPLRCAGSVLDFCKALKTYYFNHPGPPKL